MAFTENQKDRINNLAKMKGYYNVRPYIKEDEPEKIYVTKIVDLILSRDTFEEEDFKQMEEWHNKVVEQEHLNGTGWMDFQIRFGAFLRAFSKSYTQKAFVGKDKLKISIINLPVHEELQSLFNDAPQQDNRTNLTKFIDQLKDKFK